MALERYGVLKGTVTDCDGERTDRQSPHLQIGIDADGRSFRAAVNVKSRERPSSLVYRDAPRFAHPQLRLYPPMPAGFTRLESRAGSGAIDFIRGNMFDFEEVVALPPDAPGRDDDLLDKLEAHLRRARNAPGTDIYVFGEPFPDGIHDVHMNQGSVGTFASSNGVWQDGAVLLHDRDADDWTALFLAFQSQAIHTDDRSGDALPGSATFEDVVRGRLPGRVVAPAPAAPETGEPGITPDGLVRIVAAVVNPVGPEDRAGGERVSLLNAGTAAVDLTGWTLAASRTSRMALAGSIAPGTVLQVEVVRPLTLSNQGGIVSLLDPRGNRVHGVSYTRAQARTEGLTITF